GDALRVDDEHVQRGGLELFDRAVGEFHAENEVRLERHDLLEIHLDTADMLSRRGLGGLVGEIVDADHARARTEREEERRDRRTDGYESLGTRRDRDRAVLEVAQRRRERRGGDSGRGGNGNGTTAGGEREEEDREEDDDS